MKRLITRLLPKKPAPRVYLDYAAATPVSREVLRAMAPYEATHFGNASAIHAEGQKARDAIDAARESVARSLKVRSEEVFFTSGGTESNNLAIMGVLDAVLKDRPAHACEVITTPLEHPSVREVLARYAKRGVVIHEVPVSSEGLIDERAFAQLLTAQTVLITLAYANSEIGVVQDVKALTRIVRAHKAQQGGALPYVHLDASQAPLYLTCAFDVLGVDLMTLDAGKCYGPKGVGVLIKKHHVPLTPLFAGGDQEEGLRPGTENTPLIVGCAIAIVRAQQAVERRVATVTALRDYAFAELERTIDGILINGSRTKRIAHNINISIPGIDGEYAAVVLDYHGFAVSTKSACSGASGSGSHVIYALGGDDARALSTLRLTIDETTTKRNIRACVRVLGAHVTHMREKIDQMRKK